MVLRAMRLKRPWEREDRKLRPSDEGPRLEAGVERGHKQRGQCVEVGGEQATARAVKEKEN